MALAAPTYRPGVSGDMLQGNRTTQTQQGEVSPQAAALNARIQQLPSYQQYLQLLQRPHSAFEQQQVAQSLASESASLNIPDTMIFDPYTGQIREKNWNERHSNTWSALAYTGAAIGSGLTAGALAGGLAAGGGAAAAGSGYVGAGIASTAAASTGAGSIATAGGSSWLTGSTASLIGTGINVAGQIYAANKQADTSAEAARIQAEEYDKALKQQQLELDYQHGLDTYKQNQYAGYLQRLSPYEQTGQAANNELSRFMGQPSAAQTPLASQNPQRATAIGGQTSTPPPSDQAGPTVLMEGPDGSRRMVAQSDVQHYLSRGATVVQGAANG